MAYNAALADEIIGLITAEPERHDNRYWMMGDHGITMMGDHRITAAQAVTGECGTTCCVAGWAVALSVNPTAILEFDSYMIPDPQRAGSSIVRAYHSSARELLGLRADLCQDEWLFEAVRTTDEVLWGLKWLRDHQDADYTDFDAEYLAYSDGGTLGR